METICFVLYAGLIPAVPLIGAKRFKRQSDHRRSKICYILFAAQVVISLIYIILWVQTH